MNNGCLRVIIAIIVAILAALALWWWFILREAPDLPTARTDDAGDFAFVHQAVPTVTGRKLRGRVEADVLMDLIAETDRTTLLELMMDGSPTYADEYIGHWSDLLVDWMRVHRDTSKRQDQCFGPPELPGANESLARYIRDNEPFRGATHPGFTIGGTAADYNMSDVLRGSLKLDNLAPAWQAYLFAMVNKPITGAEVTEQNQRMNHGATFTHVYTKRQMTCLGCHTSTTSASGPESYWNRHFPVFGDFEKAVFGSSTGRDSREIEALLRVGGFRGGSIQPWGMEDCGTFRAPGTIPDDTLTDPDSGAFLEAYLVEPIGRNGSAWDIESRMRSGIETLALEGLTRGPDPDTTAACEFCDTSCAADGSMTMDPAQAANEAAVGAIVNNRCVTCHTGTHNSWAGDAWQEAWVSTGLVVPGDAAASTVIDRLTSSSSRMPPTWATGNAPDGTPLNTPLVPNDIDVVRAWINGLTDGDGDCSMCPTLDCADNRVDGDAAFSYLVAANIVSKTWAEVFGDELTIANYYPRSAGQGGALWNLTENEFLPNNWSLQRILTRMMTSELYNRRPPVSSSGDYAYELPLAFDPWTESDPRFPPRALPGWTPDAIDPPESDETFLLDNDENRARVYNGVGDTVHRYRPRSLLYSVHSALGWPAPTRFSNGSAYPSDQLRKSIGQFWRDAEPGFNDVDFQGLLTWEATHGQCQNPGPGDDWVDRLVDGVGAFNAENPSSPVTYRDLAETMKDWILGHGGIDDDASVPEGQSTSEQTLITTLLGGWDTPAVVGTVSERNALEASLRDYCGVLVQTPHFLLAGIAPPGPGPEPRLRVCNDDGRPCSYREICESFQAGFSFPDQLICHDDRLEVRTRFIPGDFLDLCPRGQCRFIDRPVDIDCLTNPSQCPAPPQCDLGCATVDCCGGPLPPIDRPGFLIDQLGGAEVSVTEGVQIKRAGNEQFEALQKGMHLAEGDLLALSAGSRLVLDGDGFQRRTPAKGMPAKGDKGTWFLMVASETPTRAPLHHRIRPTLPRAFSQGALEQMWTVNGEAGPRQMLGQQEQVDEARRQYRDDSNRQPSGSDTPLQ